jgi:hypothetical protein
VLLYLSFSNKNSAVRDWFLSLARRRTGIAS